MKPESKPIVREQLLQQLRDPAPWDAVIVGGGATGLGIAVDAAQRGLRVALIDAGDFGRGTSSRSTKLVHGGVRYLAQGNIKLVREALAERATLLRLAPQVVQRLEFVVPCYSAYELAKLRVGLGLYDALAGAAGIGATRWLSAAETAQRLPGVRTEGLRGGITYWDGQFDDALMCVSLMQTAVALGAAAINYVGCVGLAQDERGVSAVLAEDAETGERLQLNTRCVFNAAGVWVDGIRRLLRADAPPLIRVSQGSHIVVDSAFMPSASALMIPKTSDGRVLFAVPWLGKLIIGTTDSPREEASFDPQPTDAEVDFMLETARGYLLRAPGRGDVRSRFAGLRPLYSPAHMPRTSAISREHAVIDEGGLISVVGGKWTTYRRMAIDALAAAAKLDLLPAGESHTDALPLLVDPQLADPQRRAAEPDAGFSEHCRAYTQARNDEDLRHRRSRVGMLVG